MAGQEVDLWRCPCCYDWESTGHSMLCPYPVGRRSWKRHGVSAAHHWCAWHEGRQDINVREHLQRAPSVWPMAQDWRKVDRALDLPSDDEILEIAAAINQKRKRSGERLQNWSHSGAPNALDALRARERGLYGLRAVCRVLGVRGNFAVNARGPGRAHTVAPNGMPLGVCTRSMLKGGKLPDLIVRSAETPRDDLGLVLVAWKSPAYEPIFPGWICECELRAHNRTQTFREAENWTMSPGRLRPLGELAGGITCTAIARELGSGPTQGALL